MEEPVQTSQPERWSAEPAVKLSAAPHSSLRLGAGQLTLKGLQLGNVFVQDFLQRLLKGPVSKHLTKPFADGLVDVYVARYPLGRHRRDLAYRHLQRFSSRTLYLEAVAHEGLVVHVRVNQVTVHRHHRAARSPATARLHHRFSPASPE